MTDPTGLWLNANLSAPNASLSIKLLKGDAIVAHSEEISGVDSTKLRVAWLKDGSQPMGAISGGAVFRLKIYFEGSAELFALWISGDECGTSGGYMAAGGPGFPMGVDATCDGRGRDDVV